MGICNAFGACGFGGAGDLGFATIWVQTRSEFLSWSEVGSWPISKARVAMTCAGTFWFENFEGYSMDEIDCAWLRISGGEAWWMLKPCVLRLV